MELAEENGIRSIAFCCISTGVFGFPQKRAAEIAVQTVRDYRERTHSNIEVILVSFAVNIFTYMAEIGKS